MEVEVTVEFDATFISWNDYKFEILQEASDEQVGEYEIKIILNANGNPEPRQQEFIFNIKVIELEVIQDDAIDLATQIIEIA